jgi:hypothetical protein
MAGRIDDRPTGGLKPLQHGLDVFAAVAGTGHPANLGIGPCLPGRDNTSVIPLASAKPPASSGCLRPPPRRLWYITPVTRAAHLIGSIPAPDAEAAMRQALEVVGARLRFLPDGETGERYHWVIHIIEGLRQHPDLQLVSDGRWSGYDDLPKFRVRRGHRLFGATLDFGHVAAFRGSWPVFQRLRGEAGRPDLAFQVGVPGDFDMAMFTFGPAGAVRHRRPFTEATVREIHEIHALGGDDVVFQIEIPAELVAVARVPPALQPTVAGRLAAGIATIVRAAPAGARFGIHLCLGDMNHQALGRMTDVAPAVHLANALVRRWPTGRPLEFVHMPFAAAEEPPPHARDWYAPLAQLTLPPGTRLVAGLVHEDEDVQDQEQLLAMVEGIVGHEVDVAAACGLGRRQPGPAAAAMQRAAVLTAAPAGAGRG